MPRTAARLDPAPDEDLPRPRSLEGLRAAEQACRRCPLYRNATQAVGGEGPGRAKLMLIGEQPGDQEDRQGKPFVGPAGRILDHALAAAGLERRAVFITNAVKHFKHELRGKRRLHKRPNTYEIERCKWWLDREIGLVKPRVIVALGASAVRSLLLKPVSLAALRGEVRVLDSGAKLIATVHPSYLLRIIDAPDREQVFERFVTDLRMAARLAAA